MTSYDRFRRIRVRAWSAAEEIDLFVQAVEDALRSTALTPCGPAGTTPGRSDVTWHPFTPGDRGFRV